VIILDTEALIEQALGIQNTLPQKQLAPRTTAKAKKKTTLLLYIEK
jgi:hypothetical protein